MAKPDHPRRATARRAPLPASIPRPVKRTSTRHTPDRVTAHVRVFGTSLNDGQRAQVRQKLGTKLGKFASSIERVSVRVSDVNGPRGGVDQRCRVKVVLSRLPSVVVERRHSSPKAAIDAALRATEESVRRIVGRRRMKPLHRRASRTHAIARHHAGS
jgi:ribosome-associated translation inhibitor RaiA